MKGPVKALCLESKDNQTNKTKQNSHHVLLGSYCVNSEGNIKPGSCKHCFHDATVFRHLANINMTFPFSWGADQHPLFDINFLNKFQVQDQSKSDISDNR